METWLDLSDYGLRLLLVKSARGHYLVVYGDTALERLGSLRAFMFKDVPRRTDMVMADVALRNDGSVAPDRHPTLARWGAAFPNAREVPYDPALHYRDNSVQAAEVRNAPVTMALPATPLGMNKSGQEVVVDARGVRWAKDERGAYFAEGGAGVGSVDPSTFLRAHRDGTVDPDLLALCAEGLCELGYRGVATLREDDLARFLGTTHPAAPAQGSAAYQAARDAVEAASARLVHRKGRNALAAAYNASIKFHDRLAFLNDGRGPATRGMPGPLGIVAQGLLGTAATLGGKRVLVHNPGLGHAFSDLPGTCDLSFSGEVDGAGTRRMLAANGLRARPATPGEAYDAQLLDLRRRPGAASPSPAGPLTRADLVEALAAIAARADDGNTAIVVDGPADDGERQEFAVVRDLLSQDYAFDGEAVVDGLAWAGTDAAPAKHVLSVGWRRPARDAKALPPVPRAVDDWGALFKWRAEVVSGRSPMPVALTSEAAVAAGFNVGAKVAGSEFQAPYVSASRNGVPRTMVPRNLDGATRSALARAMARRGDVDAFVAEQYGYAPAELAALFSPEQVDAMALRVDAQERGRGFLNADQTGVGKGRTLAASIRRSILQGRRVLFLTERQTNLSDILRDLRHTRTLDMVRYRIINDGVQIINEDTKEVERRSDPREEIDAMMASGRWPDDGTNLVIGTYSQFSAALDAGRGVRFDKVKWLTTAIDGECDILADECHNAASHTSNVSRNLSTALARSGSPFFSSSTFAHKGSHMAFYASLLPDGVTSEELSHMLDKGAETFQEVLSLMLVQDGVMIRREFDLSDLVIETVTDGARIERNSDAMDAIAPVLSELATLDDLAAARVATLNAAGREVVPADGEPPARRGRGRGRRAEEGARPRRPASAVTRVGHGSSRYTITRIFLSSLKVDMTVDLALASLRGDEKPVIFVENTVESLLAEVGEDPEADDAGQGLGPDIRTLFRKVLRQAVTAKRKMGEDGGREVVDLREGSAAIAQAHDRILAMVERIPALPLSAIDEIKRRIEEAGFTCGEITGRSLEVVDGKVVRRAVPNPTVVKNDFNSGHFDAVIINNSGATGVDLHAGARFADRRRRHMIEHQIPSDVVKASQGRGRTNRFDQVVPPRYTTPLAGLPAEVRLAAMDNARMRRLSATTTSNRDTAALTRGIPDLINRVGDAVCADYAAKRPDLMRRLGFRVADIEENALRNERQERETEASLKDFVSKRLKANSLGEDTAKVADASRSANEILSRLVMLPVALQRKVCDELTAEFHAAIEELEAKGETPLRTQELPGIVHPRTRNGAVEQKAFEGAEVEDPDSVFDEPLYICDAALERVAKAMDGDAVVQLVEMGETASGRKRQCIDRLASGLEEILLTFLPENMPSVQVALEAGDARVTEQKRQVERLAEVLGELSPGCDVTYTVDGSPVRGVVTAVTYPERGLEHVAGSYGVDFVVPGDAKPRSMKLRTLMRDPAFHVGAGLASEGCDAILKEFNDAVHVTLSSIKLLRNNPFRALRLAVQHGVGSLKSYRLADGTVEKGVVVSKNMLNLGAIPVPIEGWEMAVAALRKGYELIGDNKGADKLLTLRSPDGETVVAKLPPPSSRRYGHIYEDAHIKNIAGRVDPNSKGAVVVSVGIGDVKDIMKGLKATGTGLWTTSVARDWAKDYLRDNQRRVEPDAPLLAMA